MLKFYYNRGFVVIEIIDKKLKGFTFIDLFAGIGGFRLAMESHGARCVYSSEWDKDARDVYNKNFGDMPHGDITKIDENTVPSHDILCAGFPCQAFSISGKQRGFEDSRGTLFFDVARIIKCKKPKVILLENVKNFATHDGGRTMEVVKSTLTQLGYSFYSSILNAMDYGIPQKRERIFMVCFRDDLGVARDEYSIIRNDLDIIRNNLETRHFSFPKPFKLTRHVEDFLLQDENLIKDLWSTRNDIVINKHNLDECSNTKSIRVGTVGKGGQGERIYSTKGIAITLSAYGGGVFAKTGGYLIGDKVRKLHPRECARLMGFPDSYRLHSNKNKAYQQLGNSVVVDVVQMIAGQLGEVLNVYKKLEFDANDFEIFVSAVG